MTTINKTVKVRQRTENTFLPACRTAELFCALIQGNSLDTLRLDAIRNLGYTIEII